MEILDRPGLLVVNADDLGLTEADTDSIFESFEAGVISSATALVWMRDSMRAAALARQSALPLGLHLNLIEPFTADNVPARVAETQLRVVERLRAGGPARYLYHRSWATDFERCISDQVAQFTQLYGCPPTHFDGHRHMHLVPNAIVARALAPLAKSRRPVNRTADESRPVKRAAREVLFQVMRRRFQTTRWCFSIRALEPSLGGPATPERLSLASHTSVEVMVHPGWADEREVLLSGAWREALAGYRRGSFADLGSAG